jgi:PAS domain S-box-containing protein
MDDLTATTSHRWRRLVLLYASTGALIGSAIVGGAWLIEIRSDELPPTFDSLRLLHRSNAMLWLIDLLPLVFAGLFGRLGYVQSRLRLANLDLEERVRARTMEMTLEKARTAAIVDNAADGIIAFYQDGRVSLFNNAAENLFGYRYSEALQRDIRTLIPAFEPVTDGDFLRFVQDAQRRSNPGTPLAAYQALRKDGTLVPIELDLSAFALGDETSYTVIVRDLSERRRQERLERSMLQLTEAVNQTQDLDSLYQSIHESLAQIIDVTNFYIALLEPNRTHYRIVFCVDERFTKPDEPLPLEKSVVRRVIDAGKPLLLRAEDFKRLVEEDELRPGASRPSVSWLGVPLISSGETIGVMAAHSHEEGIYYTSRDVWILNFVSGQIAHAIEREHARDELRQSERRYRRMIEEAGDIVFTTDLSGVFTYANPPILRLTGYEENELLGKKSSMLVDEDWQARVAAFHIRQLRERAREATHEFPIVTKQGMPRWIQQTTTLLMEKDRPVGFQAIVHDITERRDMEWALREREEQFRSLSASSPIGIFQVNPGGQCIYVNRRWLEITGRTNTEALGEGWTEAIDPRDRATFKIEWMLSREEGSSSGREVRVLRKDGTVRWVSIRWASTLDGSGQLTSYVGTFEDISARKKIELQNQVLYEISQAVSSAEDLTQFFRSIHQSLSQVIDTTNLYIALLDRETQMTSFPYAREMGADLNLAPRPNSKGLTGYVIRTGKSLLLDESGIASMYLRGEAAPVGKPARSWLGVPLLNKGSVLGAVVLQSYLNDHHFSENDVQTMVFVSSQIASAIDRKRAEEDRRRYTAELAEAHNRIKDDLKLAARIQHSRLPQEKPRFPGIEFGWLFNSCDEVAGDMFNVVPLTDHEVGVYILDVSGHGIPAALLSMALSRSMTAAPDGSGALVRTEAGRVVACQPAEVAATLNRRFPMDLEINQYFTLLYGLLNLRDHTFRYTRAGHPGPVLVRKGDAQILEDGLGPAIGIIPEMTFEEVTMDLQPGDQIVFYTDGIDEAADAAGEEFGAERILASLRAPADSMDDSIARLRADVTSFTGTVVQGDDISIIGFRITASAQLPG